MKTVFLKPHYQPPIDFSVRATEHPQEPASVLPLPYWHNTMKEGQLQHFSEKMIFPYTKTTP
ncbi:MAG TPA: hypothetical protein VF199_08300, partial [Bacillales bacterium]